MFFLKKTSFWILVILFFGTNQMQAQSSRLEKLWCFRSDTTYEVDLSDFTYNMQSEEKAKSYLKNFEKQWIRISLDFPKQKAKIELEKNDTTKDWTIDQWSTHLKRR